MFTAFIISNISYSISLYADGKGAIHKISLAAGQSIAEYYHSLSRQIRYNWEEDIVYSFYGNQGLAHRYADRVGLSFSYNDSPMTTQKQVVLKLRKAAKLALKEGK